MGYLFLAALVGLIAYAYVEAAGRGPAELDKLDRSVARGFSLGLKILGVAAGAAFAVFLLFVGICVHLALSDLH